MADATYLVTHLLEEPVLQEEQREQREALLARWSRRSLC